MATYPGVVALGKPYRTPAGVVFVPARVVMAGIEGSIKGANFEKKVLVTRADFAGYTAMPSLGLPKVA